jgi:2-keto-4-pentenoate hydratase
MTSSDPVMAARQFADHRKRAEGFTTFPGDLPQTLEQAYAIQNAAIDIWNRPIAGWKVGRISGEFEARLGENRFVGPMFADSIWPADATAPTPFPAIPGGFAALEAELVAVIDAPGTRGDWTAAECASLVRRWHVGIEVAGSPLATINDLGPLASIAGFGNNMGLILGPQVALDDPDAVQCITVIDGEIFGPRHAGLLPGGPLAAVAFAIGKLQALGHAIPEGTLISTGAITGVHAVVAGQACEARFEPGPALACTVTPP